MKIKELPISERPYEKLERHGANILTDTELLAIIIKSGNKDLNCIDVSRIILGSHDNGLSGFKYLEEASITELMQTPGIGKVKAIQLKAVIELSKRIKAIVDDKSRYTDWSTREDIKANLQVDLILLLDEFDYPPVTIDDVYKEVLEQAENFKKYS